MKFNRLVLKNFGAFYGNNEFDLTTLNKNQNVVLFGGKNGSGKTTILDSLRIVLFGAFAFGLKTDSAIYFDKIDAKLNSKAKKDHQGFFQIILELEMVENLKRNQYTLNRGWSRQRTAIKESFVVFKNGRQLEEKEVELFQTKLRDETPPQLLEFCLFDGEKIAQVISKETLSSYLSQTAKVMFNLDLFESLETDIETYLKQEKVYTTLSQDEQSLLELEQEKNILSNKKEETIDELDSLEKLLDEKNSQYSDLNRQFHVNGGLEKKERDALVKKMSDIDHRRLTMMDRNREILTSLFPFVLARDLIRSAAEQMDREAKADLKNEFVKTVSLETFNEILNPVSKQANITNELYKKITDLLSQDDTQPIHKASAVQRAEILNFYKQVRDFVPLSVLNDFKQNTQLIKEVQKIRKQIEENDASSDLKDLLEKLHAIQNEITSTQFRKEQMIVLLNDLTEQIVQKDQQYQSLKTKVMSSKKMGHVFEIANKVSEVSRLFRDLQLKKKLQQVELEAVRMLQIVYRKELFVTRVKINPETFQLKIFDANQEEINIDILSAGEKQILLLATVWAMAMCSKRRLPFVFDTLLGRLDQTHKKAILEQFIPRCGEQVIILSTDSEISPEQYSEFKSNVAHTYTIDFDSENLRVNKSTNYFGMENNYELSS
ncbi:DNA sulfur modification protein DndD [Paenibacillus caseinilyticus]|uniref:DNA sulfur modification protein DndD n=1 Tax=Paenibacillus caseinilyticus TaxID=3098138 RepID=UPI0022B8A82B|nr:DNA sulfur modification protein DndD [Paenibacillus caseinilyticus]MCZ8519862.1 DNA sulfur modification protein DndD [Paenibacillus caseinilyticus]